MVNYSVRHSHECDFVDSSQYGTVCRGDWRVLEKGHIASFDLELHMARHSLLWQDMVVRIGTLGQRVNVLAFRGHPKRVPRIKHERIAPWHEGGAASIFLHILKILWHAKQFAIYQFLLAMRGGREKIAARRLEGTGERFIESKDRDDCTHREAFDDS